MNKLIILGVIITVLGLIFTAQSKSLIGPSSSFMYNNPDWLTYGLVISFLGVAIIVIGYINRK